MRVLWILPLAAALGCAHPNTEAREPTPVAAAQPSPPTEPAAATAGCGLARVHFAFDSADLDDQSKAILESQAKCLKAHERLRVSIEGNTDDRGTSDYNQELGARRAQVVASYLESKGVAQDQLQTASNGQLKPLCTANDEDCWAKNRRTAIRDACIM